jgi:hypothetical protein
LRGGIHLTPRNRTVSAASDFEASYTKAYDVDASACVALANGQLRNDVVIRNLAVMARGTAS